MPKRTDIHSILIIGSGPIVIGQASEFDYSGTQACNALREEGYRVILVNSNPATIMTDPDIADVTYIEPITPEFVAAIIERERPDALLPTMGGQTALNVAVALADQGVLTRYGVELIGANLQAIRKAEDRRLFQAAMEHAGVEIPRGKFVKTIEEAIEAAGEIGFPVVIRPSFTLGGSGGGTAFNMEEFREAARHGLEVSPVHTVLVEESLLGWKEFELEVMRDARDNFVVVCSIENVDPMGIHTGDSITVAPAQTLTDREYQRMRDAAKRIIREIGVETGGSNIQFAIHPTTGRMLAIEMNPRVSRSSALASKATGFPIAKIAAKLAVGYTLDEIPNDITKETPASFEPTIDYVVVKIPRWDFEKFKGAGETLGVQMKSVGEAMAFGRNFKEALQKAIRSLEIGRFGLGADGKDALNTWDLNEDQKAEWRRKLRASLHTPRPDRIFYLWCALQLGIEVEDLHEITGIDPWFLSNIKEIVELDRALRAVGSLDKLPRELLMRAKQFGFSDRQLAHILKPEDRQSSEKDIAYLEETIRRFRMRQGVAPSFKTVDTCAAEFEAYTPYFYSTYDEESESQRSLRKKVVILGGGPNRIGQGIEFDYCCVQGVFALKRQGYETIMINCNPETVSTDYDTTDKLYFEPLTLEDVLNICELEKPDGLIVSFGGQTPLRLSKALEHHGFRILGTSPEGIDLAEDRARFGELLDRLRIPRPEYGVATSIDEAIAVAERIGYPVLVRPSYVLGGRAMEIVYHNDALRHYMVRAANVSPDHPVLIDRFLEDAFEYDVDAVSDGVDVLIGGVMEHIEEAGIHSGDSAMVLPPYMVSESHLEEILSYTKQLAVALGVKGLLNIQFAMKDDIVYVLEANPRASRTVPFVSKATGLPLVDIATRVMLGESLASLGVLSFDFRQISHVAVKESVFPFAKFPKVSMFLGPEMRSTGEVMGIDESFGGAVAKAQMSAGNTLPLSGTVLVTVNDADKNEKTVEIVREYVQLGFSIMATEGTSRFLCANGIENKRVFKVNEGRPNIVDLIRSGKIQLVINTPLGEEARYDEFAIGHAAIEHGVAFITTLSAAATAVKGIERMKAGKFSVRSLQEYQRELRRHSVVGRQVDMVK
ncbi:MAG: carbamoyl-phosphate synthase large subunit [Bacteroidota bacterium]